MTRLTLFLVLCSFAFACVGEEINDIHLAVDTVGFACGETLPDGTNRLMVARAYDPATATGEINLVVDYLRFDGLPSCRANRLVTICEEGGCPIVHRDCKSLNAEAVLSHIEGDFTEDKAIQALGAELSSDPLVTAAAPDGVVMIRVVATAQSCESLLPPDGSFPYFGCDRLLGCGYSCPGQLDQVSGDVEVGLETFGAPCTPAMVSICSALGQDPFTADQPTTWCAR